jgi:hypothetical protein
MSFIEIPLMLFVQPLVACRSLFKAERSVVHPGVLYLSCADDRLRLMATDPTRSVRVETLIPVPTPVPWTARINAGDAARFTKTLQALAKGRKKGVTPLRLFREDRSLVVTCGVQRLGVPVEDDSADPGFEMPVGTWTELDGSVVERIRNAVGFCGNDNTRDVVRGVHLYLGGAVIGTDGHRLHIDGPVPEKEEGQVVVRVDADNWSLASRAITKDPTRTGIVAETDGGSPDSRSDGPVRWLVVSEAERTVAVRIFDESNERLPPWGQLVSEPSEAPALDLVIEKQVLAETLATLRTLDRTKSACMFRVVPGRAVLDVRSIDPEGSSVALELPLLSGRSTSRFTHLSTRYLAEALDRVRTERVRLYQNEIPIGAVQVAEVAPDPDWRPLSHVVMPIRGTDPEEHEAEAMAAAS